MAAPGNGIPLLERRAIEAELLLRVYAAASASLGPQQDADSLGFTVARCAYVERYIDLGVPAHLHAVFSCRRDAAFAEGYSPQMLLERPQTIAEGHKACGFVFRWQP